MWHTRNACTSGGVNTATGTAFGLIDSKIENNVKLPAHQIFLLGMTKFSSSATNRVTTSTINANE